MKVNSEPTNESATGAGPGRLQRLGSTGEVDDAGYEVQYGLVKACFIDRITGYLTTIIDVPGCSLHTIWERNHVHVVPESYVGRIMRVYYKSPLDCFFEWADGQSATDEVSHGTKGQ